MRPVDGVRDLEVRVNYAIFYGKRIIPLFIIYKLAKRLQCKAFAFTHVPYTIVAFHVVKSLYKNYLMRKMCVSFAIEYTMCKNRFSHLCYESVN